MIMGLAIKADRQHVHGQVGLGTMTTMVVMVEHLAAMLLRGSSSLLLLLQLLQEHSLATAMAATQDPAMIRAMVHPQQQHLQDSAPSYTSMAELHHRRRVMLCRLLRLQEMPLRRLHLITLLHHHPHECEWVLGREGLIMVA